MLNVKVKWIPDEIEEVINVHTYPWIYILRATGVISIKMRFIPHEMDTSEWNFEHMT